MRKFWLFFMALAIVAGSSFAACAGVRFITDVPQNSYYGKKGSSSSSQSGESRCAAEGYTKTQNSCGKGRYAVKPCPYNGNYYKACCDNEYSHSAQYCLSKGLKPSRHSCEGMYACE